VARFGSQGAFVVVTPDVPARDLRGFVEWARANREPVNYASYGIGSGGHIVMEAFARRAGLQLNHVPYKEVVKIMADMQGGSIRVAAVDPVTPLPLLRQGKLFALGVNGRYRLPANPEVATMSEQGFPIFMESWYGFFLPRGAPTPVVERLNTEVARVVQTPEMLERFRQLNLASTPSISPDEFARFVESEVGVWGKVITDAGIRVE
jgi:tripartite-type tricarboxylate transporter receptor subunit TctC